MRIKLTASVWMEAIASLPIRWDEQQDAGRITRAFVCLLAEIERWPTPKMLIKHLPPRKELPQLEYKKQLTAEEQARGRENLKKLNRKIAEIFERKSNGSKKQKNPTETSSPSSCTEQRRRSGPHPRNRRFKP
ncbi:hypothetical protein [Neisseria bergeri]|uniref:hypothetical protein n=1 Tax=Neisseria bergeri TaxID=1906581 RepID=UPI00272A9000|nr:hypothetical protein [Neisseria bergeri]